MKRDLDIAAESDEAISRSINMRQLEGFPSSYQLKLAYEIHILNRDLEGIVSDRSQELNADMYYGSLGNLVGAALFNQAQCLLVKLQTNMSIEEMDKKKGAIS